jgi:hypothetical protein
VIVGLGDVNLEQHDCRDQLYRVTMVIIAAEVIGEAYLDKNFQYGAYFSKKIRRQVDLYFRGLPS